MNTDPVLTLQEVKEKVAERKYPRVTEELIKAKIAKVDYMIHEDTLTICIIKMVNGFMAVGKAAPADPRNFDYYIGQRYAYEDAFKQLWQLEGYQLCTDQWRDLNAGDSYRSTPADDSGSGHSEGEESA